ncbi:hypothetical protein FE257_010385 [Aspergillus nanangensis]|uniref:Uncharacterized protein n=1 Tax=Aspergillus nanangensis TaxID=2582783 RepID=A0AAD4CJ67_ASPNN|nr:hypothetical protein FE257_010385 [Aspergillus nanangensis]
MENRPPLPPRPSAKSIETGYETAPEGSGSPSSHSDINNPPPYYPSSSAPILIHNQVSDTFPRQSTVLPKPCVVPQTSHTLHGTIYRPFARAYPPDLAQNDISPTDFLAFIDGLNEVWLAHPYLQATSATSGLIGLAPLLEVQLVSLGVQIAAEYGSIKLSQMRTQAYMKLANEQLFAPRRLRAQVLKTRAMMEEVGIPGEVLELPAVGSARSDAVKDEVFEDVEGGSEGSGDSSGREKGKSKSTDQRHDPQVRRMEAIKEFVLPLAFADDLPLADNWLKRATDKQEKWFVEKQNNVLVGRREKATKLASEAMEIERELNEKIGEIEALKTVARDRATERLQGPLGESNQGRLMVQEDLEKEMKKLNKKTDKLAKEKEKRVGKKLLKSEKRIQRVEKRETKIAQKVMWVVVTGDDGRGFQNHLWEDSDG